MAERGTVEKIMKVAEFRLHFGNMNYTVFSREEFRRIWEAGNAEFRVEAGHNGQPCYYRDLELTQRLEINRMREQMSALDQAVQNLKTEVSDKDDVNKVLRHENERLWRWLKKIRDSEKLSGFESLPAYKMCVKALAGQQLEKENS